MADGTIKIDTKIDQDGIKRGISDMQKNLNGAADKLKGVGTKMSAAITAPIVGLGTVAFAAADTVDKAYREIRIGTGATGDELENLKQSFETVFVGVPDSADEVATALSNLNTYTGWTGEVLEGLTQNVLDAARTMGEDGVATSEAFGKALNAWNIPAEEAQGHLDHLYNLSQTYGVGLGELSGLVTAHGTTLKNAGFEMDEVADFMARLEANGISVTRIMPGLNQATRKWADEGKNSREELNKTIIAMQDAESETEALAIATEVFGAQGAQRMVDAVRNGAIPALDDMGETFEDSSGIIQEATEDTRTIGEEFQILKNQTTLALEPLGKILIDLAKQAIPPLIEGVTTVAEWFQNLSPHAQRLIVLVGGIAAAIGPLLSAFTTILPVIKTVAGALSFLASWPAIIIAAIAGLVALVVIYWDEIKEVTITVFTAIGDFLSETWEWIKETAIEVWSSISEFFTEAWEWIKETAVNVFNSILEFFEEWGTTILAVILGPIGILIGLIIENWDEIKEYTIEAFNIISEFLSETWESIKETVSTVVSAIIDFFSESWENAKETTITIFNAISGFLSNIWNGIRDTVSNIISRIRNTISNIWGSIKDTTSRVWNGIKNTISRIVNNVSSTVSRVFDRISSTISRVWNGVKRTTSRIWDGIVDSVKGAINGVIGAINGMLSGIGNISIRTPKIPDWVPRYGGRQLNISFPSMPRIPELNVGTNLVTADGLAMLHRGEAVVPAEHAGPYREGGGGTKTIEVVMNVDGEEVARITEPYIDDGMSDKLTLEAFMRGER